MFYGCGDLTTIPQFNTSSLTNANQMFNKCSSLTDVPLIDTSKVTNIGAMFQQCTSLVNAPALDFSKVTTAANAFNGCTNLVNVPLLDFSSVPGNNATDSMLYMFSGCPNLSNESLNNILKMCANATSYASTYKTLNRMGLTFAQAQICTTLSNYQSFVDAGWTTGY